MIDIVYIPVLIRGMKALILILITFSISAGELDWNKLIKAIHKVETGGKLGAIRGRHGELGPLQITKKYWRDAVKYGGIAGKFEDCADLSYSIIIVKAYLSKYGADYIKLNDLKSLSRIHNGGLNGAKKSHTITYWHKIRKNLI